MDKRAIRIVIIGAGSTYTPELIEGFIENSEKLRIRELALMDIDGRKLTIVGNMAVRMLRRAGLSWEVGFYTDYDCIKDADYVLTQIRVGQMDARILDERIPLKYGLIGQETCGIGGFFKALRTIPVVYEIADRMAAFAPNAVMLNFTNPSGILAQALSQKNVKSVGLCNCPYAMEKSVKETLGLPGADVEYVGLNHLSWLTAIRYAGKDYLSDALRDGVNGKAMKNIPANGFDREILQAVRGIPSTYLEYYYFRSEKLKKLQGERLSRGEVCKALEERLLAQYSDPELCVKPPELEQRGGAYYSKAAVSLLEAIENDRGSRHVVNIKNGNALPFMREDDVVEVAAAVGRGGLTPIRVEGFDNGHIIGMMRAMKDYERMAVKAAESGSKEDAIGALMLNPLCGDYHAVKACYEDMYARHRKYLK
ncbi:MAG: 6-phospho-beta-glucosidase [Clostridiales bacterium]|jgi:6-phospho-beta-glucosidase|nr:6-phospho-beta-glucosidase [Clostridiales bacterium]